MAIPNLVCLIAMSGVLVAETRTHLWDAQPEGSDRSPASQKRSAAGHR